MGAGTRVQKQGHEGTAGGSDNPKTSSPVGGGGEAEGGRGVTVHVVVRHLARAEDNTPRGQTKRLSAGAEGRPREANQNQSDPIRANQSQSEPIRANQRQ
eukprot:2847065-Pyramimonas_sp.AAC.1